MNAGSEETGEFDKPYGEVGQDEAGFTQGEQYITRREQKLRREFWDKFRRVARLIPFAQDLVAAYYCAMDAKTPLKVRAMLLGALAYFILPIDAVPDMIAGLGFTDDAAVLAAVISLVSRHIRPSHRAAAARALGAEEEKQDTPLA